MRFLKALNNDKWVQNTIFFKWLFIFCLLLTIYLDVYVFPDLNLTGLYLLLSFILGFAFNGNKVYRIIFTGFITSIRYYFDSAFNSEHIMMMIFTWVTYYIVTEAISKLIVNRAKERENLINVTMALVKSLDSRDAYTAYHSENVSNYALSIAKEMKLSKKQCDEIFLGGLLHDIGKIGIPEPILTKPSQLTYDEYEIIKQHPIIGYNNLKHMTLFKENGVLDIILYHHERFDGKGYPKGLEGAQIPLTARIVAVADAFDAMTSPRVYRTNANIEYAIEQIRKNKGSQFDPTVADIFLKMFERDGVTILGSKTTA